METKNTSLNFKVFNQTENTQWINPFETNFEMGVGSIKYNAEQKRITYNQISIQNLNFDDILMSCIKINDEIYPLIIFRDLYQPEYGRLSIYVDFLESDKFEISIPSNSSCRINFFNIQNANHKSILPYNYYGVIVKNNDYKEMLKYKFMDADPSKVNFIEFGNKELLKENEVFLRVASKNRKQFYESLRNDNEPIANLFVDPYQVHETFIQYGCINVFGNASTNEEPRFLNDTTFIEIYPESETMFYFFKYESRLKTES